MLLTDHYRVNTYVGKDKSSELNSLYSAYRYSLRNTKPFTKKVQRFRDSVMSVLVIERKYWSSKGHHIVSHTITITSRSNVISLVCKHNSASTQGNAIALVARMFPDSFTLCESITVPRAKHL